MPVFERDDLALHYLDKWDLSGQPFGFQQGPGGDVSQPAGVFSLRWADLAEVGAALNRLTVSDARPATRYSPKCLEEDAFSVGRYLKQRSGNPLATAKITHLRDALWRIQGHHAYGGKG
jgi:hypothetical protein